MFCSCNEVVNVVQASTGKLLRTLEGDTEPIMSLAIRYERKEEKHELTNHPTTSV